MIHTKSRKVASILTLSLAWVFLAYTPEARGITETTLGGSLSAEITPANPGPRTKTVVSVSSFSTDLSGATISWSLNGREQKKGVGERQFTFTTGDVGQKSVVFVAVAALDGTFIEKTLVFVPQSLDIFWEAQTYTPALYKGKALATRGSTVRLIANPQFKTEGGRTLLPRELTYSWKQEGSTILDRNSDEGVGKQTFSVKTGAGRFTRVTVSVTSPDGLLSSQKTVEIPGIDPAIGLFEEHPLFGTRTTAIGTTLTLEGEETTIRAEPFFFSLPITGFAPSWQVNGEVAESNPGNPWLLTVRRAPNARGTAEIQAGARHPGNQFQSAQTVTTVAF